MNTSVLYQEKHRPQFHFSPPENWMNDPNGMVYYDGEYHLFFQYYPEDVKWGPMHWGHAVSRDLIHWENLPIALYPDTLGHIFSGSAVVDWQNSSGLGINNKPPLIAIFTHHDMEGQEAGRTDYEYQSIAFSNDKGRSWTMYEGNPVIPNINKVKDFRDPKVLWDKVRHQWVMVFATPNHTKFWTSKNLIDWRHMCDWGEAYGEHNGVWECPDLFPLPVGNTSTEKWVLLQSLNPGGINGGSATQYFIGDFDGEKFTLDEDFAKEVSDGNAIWIDYGRDNYAGVTWSDIPEEDGRRIFIGWMSNWDYGQVLPTEKWRSAMTIPRTLSLDQKNGKYRLLSQPVKELEKLRGKQIQIAPQLASDQTILIGSEDFTVRQMEAEIRIDLEKTSSTIFGIELTNGVGERYRFGYEVKRKQFFSDRSAAVRKPFSEKFSTKNAVAPRFATSQKLTLRFFIDAASIEVFIDDGAVTMTEIFFPSEDFNQLSVFCKDGQVRLSGGVAYELAGIW